MAVGGFGQLRHFLVFTGSARSGTTLVRSLLNAHPQILLSNEADILRWFAAGEDMEAIIAKIVENERRFSENPVSTDYSYRVSPSGKRSAGSVRVIGDKQVGWFLGTEPRLAEIVRERIFPMSLRVLHCVRNPYDVIATKIMRNYRNGLVSSENYRLWRHFVLERVSADILQQLNGVDRHSHPPPPPRGRRSIWSTSLRGPGKRCASCSVFSVWKPVRNI